MVIERAEFDYQIDYKHKAGFSSYELARDYAEKEVKKYTTNHWLPEFAVRNFEGKYFVYWAL